jgi:hypothetical protein
MFRKGLVFIKSLRGESRPDSRYPISRIFGSDRGIPIDRYYIEKFLLDHKDLIRGTVLEVSGNVYTKKFGDERVERSLVLNAVQNDHVDIVGDLESGTGISENLADCFILTQTLPCIFDVKAAARNAMRLLKPKGVLLVTVPGITQISRFDYERWGHYWSFTDQSVKKLFQPLVTAENIFTKTYGNVHMASAFLYGMALHEIEDKYRDFIDPDYQMIIAAVVRR